jgi:predicted nucleic acid-binding protein
VSTRREADWCGLNDVGLIGVVLEAKRQGHIKRLERLLQSIRKRAIF